MVSSLPPIEIVAILAISMVRPRGRKMSEKLSAFRGCVDLKKYVPKKLGKVLVLKWDHRHIDNIDSASSTYGS